MNKRKQLGKAERNAVWNTYIGISYGISECYLGCGNPISQQNFECGHIISVATFGDNSLDNLRPICSACNKSIGTMNMHEFVQQAGFMSKLLDEKNGKVSKARQAMPQQAMPQQAMPQQAQNKHTRKVIGNNLVYGHNLLPDDITLISSFIKLGSSELIHLVYSSNKIKPDSDLEIYMGKVIIITNSMVYRITNGLVNWIAYADIEKISCEERNLFRNDFILITPKDPSRPVIKYKIANRSNCKFIYNLIFNLLTYYL